MALIDLTQSLEPGVPDWKGCCGFNLKKISDSETSHLVQEISTPVAVNAHMDAPLHFIQSDCYISGIKSCRQWGLCNGAALKIKKWIRGTCRVFAKSFNL